MPRGHYSRIKGTTEDRFWAKVESRDCWDFTGGRKPHGYGNFWAEKGRCVLAHRYAWETLVGPVPAGMVLDHLCRNRACVNPDHLQPVPQNVNAARGFSPSARSRRKTTCPRGHPYDVTRPNGARRCSICDRAAEAARRSTPGFKALAAEQARRRRARARGLAA
jgi:hypothetical protein